MDGRWMVAGWALLCGCTGREVDPQDVDGGTMATGSSGDEGPASGDATGSADDTSGGVGPDVLAVECGDGIVGPGEDCDDGNDVPADGCNPGCVPGGAVFWEQVLPDTDISDPYVHERLAIGPDDTIALAGVMDLDEREVGILWTIAPDGRTRSSTTVAEDSTENVRPVSVAFVGEELVVVGEAAQTGPRFVYRWRYDAGSLLPLLDDALIPVDNNGIDGAAVAPDGTIAFAIEQPSGVEVFVYDLDGPLWATSLPDARIAALAFDPIGLELVGGGELGDAPDSDTLIRWDAMGDALWSNADILGIDTLVTTTMHSVVLGGTFVSPGARTQAVAVDPGGASIWVRTSAEIGAPDADHGEPALRAVTVDRAGDVVLVGWTDHDSGSTSSWAAKLDPGGELRWQATIAAPAQEGLHDYALMVATLENGTIVVAGRLDAGPTWVRSLWP